MKKIDRKNYKWALALIAGCVGLLLPSIALQSASCAFISLGMAVAGALIMDRVNRCPHCGEAFRGLYLKQPNAGYCRKCGKMIEFEDARRQT